MGDKQIKHWRSKVSHWNFWLKKRGGVFRVNLEWAMKYKECPYCGIALEAGNVGLDHKQPLSKGGPDIESNLHLVCQLCNRAKGNMNHQQFSVLMSCLSGAPFDDKTRTMVCRKLRAAWRIN